MPGPAPIVVAWLQPVMERYDRAEKLGPPDGDGALLRWNTCARDVMKHPRARPLPELERVAFELQ